MKRSIFITGVAGSGKSSLARELQRRGYAAYDIEDIAGMFTMIHKETGEPYVEHTNNDLESVKQGDWICNRGMLAQLIQSQTGDTAFYCGVASNNDEIMPLFRDVVLIKVSSDTLLERLKSRKTDEFANTDEVREWVLSWKDWFEEDMAQKGAIVLDAEEEPVAVATRVLSSLNIGNQ